MRLSGVDPGIIRELSGIYKPFIKAFKELISNAYDADAKKITVTLAENFSTLDVLDDGLGMTPYQFHRDFARLGGSTAWLRGGKSPAGRPRIGYKGIGFLAVARYCSQLHVESRALRAYKNTQEIPRRNRKAFPLFEIVGDVVSEDFVAGRMRVTSLAVPKSGKWTTLDEGKDYDCDGATLRLISARSLGQDIKVSYTVDCSHLVLKATLDFDYLLGLEHRADLRLLDDFCKVEFREAEPTDPPFTRVRLHKLKEFVKRELSAPAAKGKARNIVFKSGKDQFEWRLARSSPIRDRIPAEVDIPAMERAAIHHDGADLPTLILKWRDEEPKTLSRPVYVGTEHTSPLTNSVVPVDIDENGLRIIGYLLARSEVIYPAEFRGISIRVREVAIGDASFLGWEHILSGPRKAALSQISGELIVLSGLEAGDAINPGRESFYEENAQFRILKRELFGSEETIGGLVGQAIRLILDRIHVRSQVTDRISEARQRRRTLTDISSAVNFYVQSDVEAAEGLNQFFEQKVRANGLATARDVPLHPGPKLGGFEVHESKELTGEFEIDFRRRRVLLDFEQDAWSTSVYLNGHYYEVILKQGKPDHPICEFDNSKRRIYVNWGHPVKMNMNDAAFLKSAILLRLANHAAPQNADTMMNLALNMLAFRTD